MYILNLIFFHFKKMIKDFRFFSFVFLMPVAFIIFFTLVDQSNTDIANHDFLVINHSPVIEEEVKPLLSKDIQENFTEDKEQALQALENRETALVYEIPKNFPDQPISAYSLNGINQDPLFEASFLAALNQAIQANLMEDHQIDIHSLDLEPKPIQLNFASDIFSDELLLITLMVLIYMALGMAYQTDALNKLRNTNVLKRSIVANSNSWLVLGSILLGFTLSLLVYAQLAVLVGSFIAQAPLAETLPASLIVLAMSVFFSGLTLFLFRYIRNEHLIKSLGPVLAISLFFLGMGESISPRLEYVQYVSPYYWALDTVDTGQFFPHIPIIILMGAILFTAGSFKVERLIAKP